jgi:hypothetical protein
VASVATGAADVAVSRTGTEDAAQVSADRAEAACT